MTIPPILPTAVVGSYPQPDWLIDRARLIDAGVPRVRQRRIWRVEEEHLESAQNDATVLAIRAQEDAGIDIITDGEIRRESYSNRFATALDGIDDSHPHLLEGRGFKVPVPRIVAPIRRRGPVEVEDLEFLKRHTDRATKITLPGPFTMSLQAKDEFYGDGEATAMAYAAAVNEEVLDLEAAGADVIQLDEPWLRNDPDAANAYALEAINRALENVSTKTAIHLCFGYGFVVSRDKPKAYQFLEQLADCHANQISVEAAQPHLDLGVLRNLNDKTIMLGVIDLATNEVETPTVLAERIRRALTFIEPSRLMPSPDCGMKYLSREAAFGKLQSLAKAAEIVRAEVTGDVQ